MLENISFLFCGISKGRIHFYFSFKEIKSLVNIGFYQLVGELISYFGRDLDILIIGKFFGSNILGAYSLIKQLCYKPYKALTPIIFKVATPTLSKFQNNLNDLKNNFILLNRTIVTIYIIIPIIFFIFSEIIISIIYGKELLEFNTLFKILCLYVFIRSIGSSIGSLVVATGKTKLGMYWNLCILFLFPIPILFGISFNIEILSTFMIIYSVLIYYPMWRFVINKMIPISFNEYITSFMPMPKVLFHKIKSNYFN